MGQNNHIGKTKTEQEGLKIAVVARFNGCLVAAEPIVRTNMAVHV